MDFILKIMLVITVITAIVMRIAGWGIGIGFFASLILWIIGQDLWLDRALVLLMWSAIVFFVSGIVCSIAMMSPKFLSKK